MITVLRHKLYQQDNFSHDTAKQWAYQVVPLSTWIIYFILIFWDGTAHITIILKIIGIAILKKKKKDSRHFSLLKGSENFLDLCCF